jgi:hypothetical protein
MHPRQACIQHHHHAPLRPDAPPPLHRSKSKSLHSNVLAETMRSDDGDSAPMESWMSSQLAQGVLKPPSKTSCETKLLRCVGDHDG